MRLVAERLTDPVAFHGEGPFWDARTGRLLFVDMLAGAVVSYADGVVRRHPVPSPVASVVRARRRGGYVLALEHGFALADESLERIEPLPPVTDDPGEKLNEGGCDPWGRFYTGSMAYSMEEGRGTMWRLDADLTTRVVLRNVTISNGLQFSADGRRAFYNDTPTGRVDVIELSADGEFGERRPFVAVEDTEGLPDGMAIDAEGGLWVALWGGSAVRHYSAAGELVDEVELPVSHVTACAFGGEELRTLYITTSAHELPPGAEPLAGSLFAVETPVAGAPAFDFAG